MKIDDSSHDDFNNGLEGNGAELPSRIMINSSTNENKDGGAQSSKEIATISSYTRVAGTNST